MRGIRTRCRTYAWLLLALDSGSCWGTSSANRSRAISSAMHRPLRPCVAAVQVQSQAEQGRSNGAGKDHDRCAQAGDLAQVQRAEITDEYQVGGDRPQTTAESKPGYEQQVAPVLCQVEQAHGAGQEAGQHEDHEVLQRPVVCQPATEQVAGGGDHGYRQEVGKRFCLAASCFGKYGNDVECHCGGEQ